MAPTAAATGTQTATIGTEHTLYTQTTAHTSQLDIDTVNGALGDIITIKVYKKTLTSDTLTPGTTLPIQSVSYFLPRAEPGLQSIPLTVAYGAVYTITQTAGTGRNFPWAVLFLD